jgi:uncharacterized protein (TIRG00374 family)
MPNLQEESLTGVGGRSSQRLTAGLVLIIALAGFVVVFLDWERFAPVIYRAEATPVLVGLLFTALSYTCVSIAFALVSRMLSIEMSLRDLAEVGFVSTILNHVVTTGGVAGYSVRYLLMHRHRVTLKEVLAASILHFYLTSLDMLTMLPVGFLYLLLNATLPAGVTVIAGLMTLFMAAVAILATGMIFRENWRRRLEGVLSRLGKTLMRKDFGPDLHRFDTSLSSGVDAIRRQPVTLLLVMALTWIDWFASVAVVWLCFDAFGDPVQLGIVLSGYVIGVMAGVLSMIRGFGVGGLDGGCFCTAGVSFEQAFLAPVLFRSYFSGPYVVSLVFIEDC